LDTPNDKEENKKSAKWKQLTQMKRLNCLSKKGKIPFNSSLFENMK
jgi:hypothetical protein